MEVLSKHGPCPAPGLVLELEAPHAPSSQCDLIAPLKDSPFECGQVVTREITWKLIPMLRNP